MRYRKRPIAVEAVQWHGPEDVVPGVACDADGRHYVTTIHAQRAYLDPGDWVIAESDGLHHYPCKPAEFDRIYEETA